METKHNLSFLGAIWKPTQASHCHVPSIFMAHSPCASLHRLCAPDLETKIEMTVAICVIPRLYKESLAAFLGHHEILETLEA
jgi:hypothetical protein